METKRPSSPSPDKNDNKRPCLTESNAPEIQCRWHLNNAPITWYDDLRAEHLSCVDCDKKVDNETLEKMKKCQHTRITWNLHCKRCGLYIQKPPADTKENNCGRWLFKFSNTSGMCGNEKECTCVYEYIYASATRHNMFCGLTCYLEDVRDINLLIEKLKEIQRGPSEVPENESFICALCCKECQLCKCHEYFQKYSDIKRPERTRLIIQDMAADYLSTEDVETITKSLEQIIED
jgi:hypothetical protein